MRQREAPHSDPFRHERRATSPQSRLTRVGVNDVRRIAQAKHVEDGGLVQVGQANQVVQAHAREPKRSLRGGRFSGSVPVARDARIPHLDIACAAAIGLQRALQLHGLARGLDAHRRFQA